jgi:NADPH:quinone reductase-like Zn-dependent oxidoreductase
LVYRGRWRLAAAAEPQAVQAARTEVAGETGAAGASEASSKLVLVVGGTGGVGKTAISLLYVPALIVFSYLDGK